MFNFAKDPKNIKDPLVDKFARVMHELIRNQITFVWSSDLTTKDNSYKKHLLRNRDYIIVDYTDEVFNKLINKVNEEVYKELDVTERFDINKEI